MLYRNDGKTARYIGGKLIPPGQAREVDPTLIPPQNHTPKSDDVTPSASKTSEGEGVASDEGEGGGDAGSAEPEPATEKPSRRK